MLPSVSLRYRGLVEQMGKSKEHKKTNVKPFMVKNYLSIFVNCMIENPAFDSQARSASWPDICSSDMCPPFLLHQQSRKGMKSSGTYNLAGIRMNIMVCSPLGCPPKA